jgi:hypothetical protein
MKDIRLGDTVECKYTGIKGVATSKIEFINKCIQFGVAPKWNPKAAESSETFVDSQSLNLIKKGERWDEDDEDDDEPTGGPMRKVPGMRGY